MITEATAELATSCYAGMLMLQAMGLGGWMFDGVDRHVVLGASGDPQVPGLGFRYDTFEKFPATVPSVFSLTYLQAHHLDLEFYDHHFEPGAYLPSHAGHMARWHGQES